MNESMMLMFRDTMTLLIEKAREAKAEKDSSNSDYDIGRLMAFHDIISTIQQQASAFGVSLAEIGLDSVDPDVELL